MIISQEKLQRYPALHKNLPIVIAVKLADSLPMLKNYHFREDVQDGQMVFDYKLYPGPCPTRNALKIMQLAGLPISWEEK